MSLILLVACLAPIVVIVGSTSYGMISTCGVQYVRPGDDFDIYCKTDHGLSTRIYLPTEELPSREELLEDGEHIQVHGGTAERTTTINEYEDATKGVDDGFYPCVVQHGPGFDVPYSEAECEVRIVDLCAESNCAEAEICEPDYESGTVKCTCNYACPSSFDVICSDRCEVFWNECAMEESTCIDRKARSIASEGFCPGRVEPDIRHIDQDIECELGEEVILDSGLLKDGTPLATIQWKFYPGDGTVTYLAARDQYELVCNENTAGTYNITLMHCLDADNAVRNEYRLKFKAPTEAPSTTLPTSTPTFEPDDLTVLSHVCSLYPGGVIEDFNSGAHFYDLSCTHILAADLMPSGNYYAPWFIYGTFDKQHGMTALAAMAFYLGNNVFEFQRGWIVNTGKGNKLVLEEGVAQTVGESGCYVVFSDRHLNLDCEYFTAHYDGLMSGHIKLKTLAGDGNLQKGRGNIGLCFDSMSGWRTNWQVGNTKVECKVDGDAQECSESASCDLAEPEQVPGTSWSTCGVGANAACDELNCGGADPSPAQECALKQANRINCSLKMGMDLFGQDESCPEDPCEWMVYVAHEGCPQENLPFVCPGA